MWCIWLNILLCKRLQRLKCMLAGHMLYVHIWYQSLSHGPIDASTSVSAVPRSWYSAFSWLLPKIYHRLNSMELTNVFSGHLVYKKLTLLYSSPSFPPMYLLSTSAWQVPLFHKPTNFDMSDMLLPCNPDPCINGGKFSCIKWTLHLVRLLLLLR